MDKLKKYLKMGHTLCFVGVLLNSAQNCGMNNNAGCSIRWYTMLRVIAGSPVLHCTVA